MEEKTPPLRLQNSAQSGTRVPKPWSTLVKFSPGANLPKTEGDITNMGPKD
ncbi:hypothetical protein Tco_0606575, partial [Tanacetum coccineum]